MDNGQIDTEVDVKQKAYEVGNILDAINAKRVSQFILILDSCRKVPLGSSSSSTAGLAVMNVQVKAISGIAMKLFLPECFSRGRVWLQR